MKGPSLCRAKDVGGAYSQLFGFSFLASRLPLLSVLITSLVLWKSQLDSLPFCSLGLPLEAVGVLKHFNLRFADSSLVIFTGAWSYSASVVSGVSQFQK